MRVGILTLHARTNYGAVLQAYALKSAIDTMGLEARSMSGRRRFDLGPFKVFSVKGEGIKGRGV